MKKIAKLGDIRIVKKIAWFPFYIQQDDLIYRICFLEKYLSHQKYIETYTYEGSLTGPVPSAICWVEFKKEIIV